jgi:hypothetical protein
MVNIKVSIIICIGLLIILSGQTYADDLLIFRTYDKSGYIDKTGKVIIEAKFDETQDFSEGLGAARVGSFNNGKWGYIDETGKLIIDTIYNFASQFSQGLAMVGKDGKFGFINKTGKIVIPVEYKLGSVGNNGFSEGRAFVGNGLWSYICIDRNGKQVGNRNYSDNGMFSEGLAPVSIWDTTVHKTLYGYIDTTAAFVIRLQFNGAKDFSDGLAAVNFNDKWGFIDQTGKIVIEPQYDAVSKFSEGIAPVKINGKYGAIDKTGKLIIVPKFVYLSRFSEGLAVAGDTNKNFGYIDKTGEFIIAPTFSGADPFQNGIAKIWQGYLIGYINQKGEYLYNPIKQ